MWLAVVTALWIYRNKVIFDAGKVDEVEIFAIAQLHAWSWAKFSGLKLQGTFTKWCIHLIDCLREIK